VSDKVSKIGGKGWGEEYVMGNGRGLGFFVWVAGEKGMNGEKKRGEDGRTGRTKVR